MYRFKFPSAMQAEGLVTVDQKEGKPVPVSFPVPGLLASDVLFHFPSLPATHQQSSCTSSKLPVSVNTSHSSKLSTSFHVGDRKGFHFRNFAFFSSKFQLSWIFFSLFDTCFSVACLIYVFFGAFLVLFCVSILWIITQSLTSKIPVAVQ